MINTRTAVRPLSRVPVWIWAVLMCMLMLQLVSEARRPLQAARYAPLGAAPPAALARALALGDPLLASRAVVLILQAHDTQPGYSAPLSQLDYDAVVQWLELALALDPSSQYPLLSASRIYASVADEPRRRRMLEFIHRAFLAAPDTRWRWMAEAALTARHRLQDQPLALRYAAAITEHARSAEVPGWARDMSVFMLQDMGDLEAATALIAALLHEGRVTDPNEKAFLLQRLEEMERH